MKLRELAEAIMYKSGFKKEGEKALNATKAADLVSDLDKVRDEKDLGKKKDAAKVMAKHFKVGGKEKFLSSLDAAKTAAEVDKLAYNAALKGEGKGTKLY